MRHDMWYVPLASVTIFATPISLYALENISFTPPTPPPTTTTITHTHTSNKKYIEKFYILHSRIKFVGYHLKVLLIVCFFGCYCCCCFFGRGQTPFSVFTRGEGHMSRGHSSYSLCDYYQDIAVNRTKITVKVNYRSFFLCFLPRYVSIVRLLL